MGCYLGKDELKQQSSFWFLGQTSGQVRGRSHLPDNNQKSPGTRFPVQHDLWEPRSHFKEHKSQGNHLISWRQMADRCFFPLSKELVIEINVICWPGTNQFKRSSMFPTLHKAVIRCDTQISAQLPRAEISRQPEALSNHHVNFSTSPFLERSATCQISHAGRCCATTRRRTTRRTKFNYWQKQKKVDQQTPFLCSFFHRSSSMLQGPLFHSGSLTFFDQCPSPACVYCLHPFWSARSPH